MAKHTIYLFAAIILFLCTCCEDHDPPVTGHDIGIRTDAAGIPEFYRKVNGVSFVMRGNNLIDEGGQHTLLDVGRFDRDKMAASLVKMRFHGYNTVRIYINRSEVNGISDPTNNVNNERPDGFDPAYISNIHQFLDLLQRYNMYAIFTSSWPPNTAVYNDLWEGTSEDFEFHNRMYLSPEGHVVMALFWKNFARRMKQSQNSHHILAYAIQNELAYDRYTSDGNGGTRNLNPWDTDADGNFYRVVTTADGNTYDLSNADEVAEARHNNAELYLRTIKEAIKEEDEEVLVSTGFMVTGRYGKELDVNRMIHSGVLDYVDIHIYPHEFYNSVEEYATFFGLNEPLEVPIIVGEFGATRYSFRADPRNAYRDTETYSKSYAAARDLVAWQIDLCPYNIKGYLTWTYKDFSHHYTAIADESQRDDVAEQSSQPIQGPKLGYVGHYLAPIIRPDICSRDVNYGPPLR